MDSHFEIGSFYERLVIACTVRDTNPTAVCRAIGLSEAAATRWRRGSRPHDTTIKKIADHLKVNVYFLYGVGLLGKSLAEIEYEMLYPPAHEPNTPDSETQTIIDQLTETLSQLTVEELKEIDRYVDYLVNRKK